MKEIKTAVVGVGAFGENHARVYSELKSCRLVAVVDRDLQRARAVAEKYGCEAWDDHRRLAGEVDAASIAVPTVLHADIGVDLLEAGLDVLVEKPIAADLDGADRLIAAADRAGGILQIGHLERFNPAVEAAVAAAELPLFFEIHRLGAFSPRSLDVDVLLDLMIHDLDILLAMTHVGVDRIEASGIPILSDQPDIASVRVVFENGCVANLTASRISTEKVRKLRFFQPRQYLSIDYSRQDGVHIGLDGNNQLTFAQIRPGKAEPLARQLDDFLACAAERRAPRVGGPEARAALELALKIRAEMDRHSRVVAATLAAHRR